MTTPAQTSSAMNALTSGALSTTVVPAASPTSLAVNVASRAAAEQRIEGCGGGVEALWYITYPICALVDEVGVQKKKGRGVLKGFKASKKCFANGSAKLNITFSEKLGGIVGMNYRSFKDDVVVIMKRKLPLIGVRTWSGIHPTIHQLIVVDMIERSQKNIDNRKKLKTKHIIGSKSYSQVPTKRVDNKENSNPNLQNILLQRSSPNKTSGSRPTAISSNALIQAVARNSRMFKAMQKLLLDVRSNNDTILYARAGCHEHGRDAFAADSIAMSHAISLSADIWVMRVIFETDSQLQMEALNINKVDSSAYAAVIEDTKYQLKLWFSYYEINDPKN
uniref:Uncharacterized protein n=1 Tax=Aegilops tauschii TaxID=37682 RepID=R7W2P0_AEGTA